MERSQLQCRFMVLELKGPSVCSNFLSGAGNSFHTSILFLEHLLCAWPQPERWSYTWCLASSGGREHTGPHRSSSRVSVLSGLSLVCAPQPRHSVALSLEGEWLTSPAPASLQNTLTPNLVSLQLEPSPAPVSRCRLRFRVTVWPQKEWGVWGAPRKGAAATCPQ